MSDKSLKKGVKQKLLGIGGKISEAYGHKIKFSHAYFRFETYVFFLENQSVPLLGMHGFIDKFKSVTLSSEDNRIIFETYDN